jgi:hypothetical protein
LPGIEKQYFVFTDSEEIPFEKHIKTYYEKPKGFPLDSLLRFDMFLRIKEDTRDCDYLFFFNSNVEFNQTITEEIFIPSAEENNLLAVLHPGYFNKKPFFLPIEKRKVSAAYIPYKKNTDYHYFMGSSNGGSRDAYYKLIQVCHDQIHTDIDNGVMAVYHDESHINKYLHERKIKMLPPSFGHPEGNPTEIQPYITILNKMRHGGKYFDKLPKKSYGKRIFLLIKRTYRSILWVMNL